ncbi:MAG TPA: LamG domain-containing protein [Kofleriaceae bacterium]|nr:LamG domain-containing protein [Kofleriaceae bacterium]
MRRLALISIVLVGCGRISFEPHTAHDDGAIGDVVLDQPGDATVDPDLLFYVSFDGGLADDARGHALSCMGTCDSIPGRVGPNAVHLNGASCIVLPDAGDLHPATYTVSVWARLPVPAANSDLVAHPLNGATSFIDTFELWVQPDSGVVMLANSVQVLTTGLDVTTWHHYVAVYDGSAVLSYVDGGLAGGSSGTTTTMYGADPYLIGCDRDNGTEIAHLTGDVDDVRFYGRALTANEIVALANL